MLFKDKNIPPAFICWPILIVAFFLVVLFAFGRLSADRKQCRQAAPEDYQPNKAHIVASLKAVADHSKELSNWAVLMIAGAIAAIVGTSYLRPAELSVRLAYLLFPLAWTFLGFSIHGGRATISSYLAATLVPEKHLYQTVSCANAAYSRQNDFMLAAIVVMGIWLLIYLHWWIFIPKQGGDTCPKN